MAQILWACWDGGGNLTPSLGIAAELERRGHEVHFRGRPEMVDRVRAAGFDAQALTRAREDLDRYGFHPLPTVFGFTSSPAVGEEVLELVHESQPDVVVVDAMFAAALDVAPRFGRPTAVMLHTFFDRLVEGWQRNFTMQSESRVRAGFSPLPALDVLWGERDVLHVNTLAALDGPPATTWTHVRHGAPVLSSEPRARVELPLDRRSPDPLVLLSFSTVPEQRSVDSLQNALVGLAKLPVQVVATTGGIVDPGELTVPDNAVAVPFADHDLLLARASLVVGHGGHGTTMRALRAGVPLVAMPALGADQAPITRFVEEIGVGRALANGSDAAAIEDVTSQVLSDASYRQRAQEVAALFDGLDGASLAADSVEQLLAADPAR